MRSFDELEALWQAGPASPAGRGVVRLVVARLGGGEHATPASVRLDLEHGLVGDRWAAGELPSRERQVTVMNARVAELVAADVHPLHMAGDNLIVDLDLSATALPIESRLRIGGALLEVTPVPHAGCAKFSARFGQDALRWVNWPEHRDRRLRGVNCTILEGGEVAVGDAIEALRG